MFENLHVVVLYLVCSVEENNTKVCVMDSVNK